jgi:hypothetical protein
MSDNMYSVMSNAGRLTYAIAGLLLMKLLG